MRPLQTSTRLRVLMVVALLGCAFIVVLFFASTRRVYIWQSASMRQMFVLRGGAICCKYLAGEEEYLYGIGVCLYEHPPTPGWSVDGYIPDRMRIVDWFPRLGVDGNSALNWKGVIVPLWIPFVVVAGMTYWLWRRSKPTSKHGCTKCGYNLTGNTSGRCPECGTEIQGYMSQMASLD